MAQPTAAHCRPGRLWGDSSLGLRCPRGVLWGSSHHWWTVSAV